LPIQFDRQVLQREFHRRHEAADGTPSKNGNNKKRYAAKIANSKK